MHYLDTNILIYASVTQDRDKMIQSQSIIQELFKNESLMLSPLTLQEFDRDFKKLKPYSKIDIDVL